MEKSVIPQGWIKLHRKLIDKGFYQKSQYVHLWIHLLLTANHKPKEFMWNDHIIIIKEGQLITGRKQLSKATKINEGTIENILRLLENEHQILQQKTSKYRIITIVNWSSHQINDSTINNRVTTELQQSYTNKNDNNEKNENKTSLYADGKTFEQFLMQTWGGREGRVSPSLAKDFIGLGDRHGWDKLFEAIETAEKYNKKSFAYVKAILEPSQTKSGEEKRSENAAQAWLRKKQAEGK